MKKIIYIGFLLFIVHFFVLLVFLTRLDSYVPEHYERAGHPMFAVIAMFITFVIYILTIIFVIIENQMRFYCKGTIMLLVLGNCFQQFYINSFYQFQLFSRPQSYDLTAKIIVSLYFIIELYFSFYVINRLYNEE